jgi:hypothetical protein
MPTNVPKPTFGDRGFVAPTEAAVLAGVQADINAALGGNVNPGLTTPQGQLATTMTAIIGDANNTFLFFCNQVDPALNSGRMQDAIGRIYFMQRNPAQPTVVQATCSGLTDVVIPVGALAKNDDGNLYVCQQEGKIPVGGSVALPFACATTGPIACPVNSLNTIYQTIFGWDTVDNLEDGVMGNLVESRSVFEARRAESVAKNSNGALTSIAGAVLEVTDVLDIYATENDTSLEVLRGGVWLSPNSLYVCVLGGATQDVAEAIWSHKAPGCGYTGNTTVTVSDPNPVYGLSPPQYSVTFERPTLVPVFIVVTIMNSKLVPSDALTQAQDALIAAFAGADGGSRARIGSTLYASRYYGPMAALGTWASSIISILIGECPAASFTGSISGTVLTVTSLSAGGLTLGQLLQDADGLITPGTTINGALTGSGGVGNYSVTISQTVADVEMTALNLANDFTLNINQAPTLVADDIMLVLQ